MAEALTGDALRRKGLTALESELGRVQALRFLAMISRQPFDYQQWREEYFAGVTLDEVLLQARNAKP